MKNRTAILKIRRFALLCCAICCFAACSPEYPKRPVSDAGTRSLEGLIEQENGGQAPEGGTQDMGDSGQEGGSDVPDTADGGKLGLDGNEYAEEMSPIRQEDICQMGDALMYDGVSFCLLSYERTKDFGDRVSENLSDWFETDADKNLTGDYYYIFLTLRITNESSETIEVHRTHGEIAAVKENMEYCTAGEPCYVDEEYTEGDPSSVWAWKFEPGESITCEVGYIIEGDCLEDYLYYKFITSENEEFADKFIKLE